MIPVESAAETALPFDSLQRIFPSKAGETGKVAIRGMQRAALFHGQRRELRVRY
jgi:hypothetical protein